MATKYSKKASEFQSTMKEALEKFDLKLFKKWMQKYNHPLWNSFKKENETLQMATMCKAICNRTDLFNTEAFKKAVNWLKNNNMKGGIY